MTRADVSQTKARIRGNEFAALLTLVKKDGVPNSWRVRIKRDGKWRQKSFSIRRYGPDAARRLAVGTQIMLARQVLREMPDDIPKRLANRFALAEKLCVHGSLKTTGEALGVSKARVRQLTKKAERDRALPKWTTGLNVRIARILVSRGFTSKEAVRIAIERSLPIPHLKLGRLRVVNEWLVRDGRS